MVYIFTYNLMGGWMLMGSITIMIGFCKITGADNEAAAMLSFGVPAMLFDLAYRFRKKNGHWLQPTKGGMFMHIPIWIYGFLGVLIGVWCAYHRFVISK